MLVESDGLRTLETPRECNHCPKTLHSNIITSGAKISTYVFKGDTNIQTITQQVSEYWR